MGIHVANPLYQAKCIIHQTPHCIQGDSKNYAILIFVMKLLYYCSMQLCIQQCTTVQTTFHHTAPQFQSETIKDSSMVSFFYTEYGHTYYHSYNGKGYRIYYSSEEGVKNVSALRGSENTTTKSHQGKIMKMYCHKEIKMKSRP